MMDAGEMNERVEVLRLAGGGERYYWDVAARSWAKAELQDKTTIFAKNGVGARSVRFTMRHRDSLTLWDALRWRKQHCFITSIIPADKLHDTISCAIVEPRTCRADINCSPVGPEFPGILTEKYVGHFDDLEPLATNVTTYVLVTPKVVHLKRGALVEIDGTAWHVLLHHILDPNMNEYEVRRTEDL